MSYQRYDYDVIANWIEPGERVLDLGCGDGSLLRHLSTVRQVRGYGVENDPERIVACARNGINVIQIDMEQGLAGFDDGFFDHVIMSLSLQAMRNTQGILAEMLRVGREAVVSFPNFAYWRHRQAILNGRMPVSKNLPYQWYDTPNVRFFTIVDFEALCAQLGIVVRERLAFDEAGRPVRGEKGELVCTRPFPVMPVGFWNDTDGTRYRAAYFARFDNVWCHGDYSEITAHDGLIIYGRSDATLNPGGVRIGTSEIYRYVEQLDEVEESIVIGQQWKQDERVVLFVKLKAGCKLDDGLRERICQQIKRHCTARHVPARILQVDAIPRTKSGKIVELAVREVVHNRPVNNTHALADPEVLNQYRNRPELAS